MRYSRYCAAAAAVMAVALAFFAACAPAGAQPQSQPAAVPETIDLVPKWPVGKRVVQKMEMQANIKMSMGEEMPMPAGADTQKMTQTQEIAFDVISRDAQGVVTLDVSYPLMEMEIAAMGKTMRISTKEPTPEGQEEDPMKKALRLMTEGRIQLVVDASNQVLKVEGFEAMMKRYAEDLPPDARQALGQLFSDEKASSMFRQMFGLTSSRRAVKAGDTWEDNLDTEIPVFGKMKVNIQTTCAGWETREGRRLARLDFKGAMSLGGETPSFMGAKFQMTQGEMEGSYWVDPALGLTVDMKMDQKMALRIEPPPTPNQPAPKMAMTMEQNITMKLDRIEERPAAPAAPQ